jgi:phosphoglycerol transferase MdoB-like AlkP superfamily enzyme
MQSIIDNIENLISRAGDIAETKVELWKLRAAGKISETVSSIISVIAIFILTITILSIGGAFWIGSAMGNISYGFFIVGGFYVLAGFLVYVFRRKLIKNPLTNLIINKIIK